jgi:hypothetical protein
MEMNKRHRRLGPLLLALLLSLGTIIVWGFLWTFWDATIRERQFRQRELSGSVTEYLRIAEDGTPVIGSSSASVSGMRFRTLDGDDTDALGTLDWRWLPGPEVLRHLSLPVEWSRRILATSDQGFAPQYWYLIHDGRPEGSAWLEGFDSTSKQRVGYMGRHGYRDAPPAADDLFPIDWPAFQALGASAGWSFMDQFSSTPRFSDRKETPDNISPWVNYLVTDGSLVEIDLRERKVRTLLEDPGIVSPVVVSHLTTESSVPTSASRRFVVARSADRLWIVDPLTNQSHELPIPDDFKDLPHLGVFLLDDQILMVDPAPRVHPTRLVWLSRDGRVLREHSVSLRSDVHRPQRSDWTHAAALPVPIAHALNVCLIDPLEQLQRGTEATYVQAWIASWRRWRGPFVAVCLLSMALAVWCFWRHRRYAQPGAWAWGVFVLLLGVPGLIGYLLHRRWPVREPCPACGRRAVVDRETCQHCVRSSQHPPLRGIEVFG